MPNWREIICSEMGERGDTWDDILSTTMSDEESTKVFDDDFGGVEGIPFTIWTANAVYFPVCYDGAEWCGSVARNPDGKPTHHMGGG
jgi:hypothetical protein